MLRVETNFRVLSKMMIRLRSQLRYFARPSHRFLSISRPLLKAEVIKKEVEKTTPMLNHDKLVSEFFEMLSARLPAKDQDASIKTEDTKDDPLAALLSIERKKNRPQSSVLSWPNLEEGVSEQEGGWQRLGGQRTAIQRVMKSESKSELLQGIVSVMSGAGFIARSGSEDQVIDSGLEISGEALPRWLATAIRVAHIQLEPYIAHALLQQIRSLPLVDRVSWLDSSVYHELIALEWACFGDLGRVKHCVEDMLAMGLLPNSNTFAMLKKIKEELPDDPSSRSRWRAVISQFEVYDSNAVSSLSVFDDDLAMDQLAEDK